MPRSHLMKYLMFDFSVTGMSPLIFPATMRHAHVAHDIGYPVRSGGLVEINAQGRAETYGEALSMKLKPHVDDAKIIDQWMRQTDG